jgi:uncharacterized membrane protein HdeD (DUF308 family)
MATAFSPKNVHQRAREALLSSNWWAAAIRGVIAILVGAFAIFAPAATLIALVMIFAAYAMVDGVFAIVLAIRGARKHERWGWLLVNGIISIAAAAVAIIFPGLTAFAFAILFAVWAIFSGSASLVAGIQLGSSHGRWWLILGGLIGIFFGIWAVLVPPIAMLALSYMVGFQAFLAGFTLLALAYRLREQRVDRHEEDLDRAAPANAREAHHHG